MLLCNYLYIYYSETILPRAWLICLQFAFYRNNIESLKRSGDLLVIITWVNSREYMPPPDYLLTLDIVRWGFVFFCCQDIGALNAAISLPIYLIKMEIMCLDLRVRCSLGGKAVSLLLLRDFWIRILLAWMQMKAHVSLEWLRSIWPSQLHSC